MNITRSLLIALLSIGSVAHAETEPFVGEISTFAGSFCPRGWAPLNGQLLPINQHQALFSLLGTSYGGDDRITFALPLGKPELTSDRKALVQCIALQGVFPSRN